MLKNDTRNQHFLSRAEQRLNSINQNNQKIYSFRLLDRANYLLELESDKGRSIERNLSIFDLFSFDVFEDSKIRMNFESLFNEYESNVAVYTKSLLQKLSDGTNDIKKEVIDLFTAKLLNFIRNPFCIEKMLNTYITIATLEPVDPVLLNCYRRIISGKRPHQTYLCNQLGISDQAYVQWLRVLFMLLIHGKEGHPNIFEGTIKSLMEDRETNVSAFVYEYDSESCLLSDRGFSQPIPDGKHMAFSFNLCSNAFIHYIFSDIEEIIQNRFSPEVIESFKNGPVKMLNVTFKKNDLAMLSLYNKRVIEQCYERVYCATTKIVL